MCIQIKLKSQMNPAPIGFLPIAYVFVQRMVTSAAVICVSVDLSGKTYTLL